VKRLLYVVPTSFGLNYPLRGHLAFLRRQGFEVDVVCEQDARSAEAAKREDVSLHPITITNGLSPLTDGKAFFQLVGMIKRRKYDVVYCCTKKGGLLATQAARFAGNPKVVYVVFGLRTEVGGLRSRLFPVIEKTVCNRADAIVFMSQSNLDFLRNQQPQNRHKMRLVGGGSANGVDIDRFQLTHHTKEAGVLLRDKLGIPRDAFVAGFVGRLTRLKGIRELTEAWKQLREKQLSARLLFVCPPEVGPDVSDVVDVLRKDNRVHFAGFMPDPVPALAAMNCLVLPSYPESEGLPVVLLEAAAMEVPAVATRVIGCTDAVVHEETGLLTEPFDASALAASIKRVLLSPREAENWGRHARELCIRRFSQPTIWQGYVDLYMELTEPRLQGSTPSSQPNAYSPSLDTP
jgi:glycosyltransferase involved in cell wall biosynthesis